MSAEDYATTTSYTNNESQITSTHPGFSQLRPAGYESKLDRNYESFVEKFKNLSKQKQQQMTIPHNRIKDRQDSSQDVSSNRNFGTLPVIRTYEDRSNFDLEEGRLRKKTQLDEMEDIIDQWSLLNCLSRPQRSQRTSKLKKDVLPKLKNVKLAQLTINFKKPEGREKVPVVSPRFKVQNPTNYNNLRAQSEMKLPLRTLAPRQTDSFSNLDNLETPEIKLFQSHVEQRISSFDRNERVRIPKKANSNFALLVQTKLQDKGSQSLFMENDSNGQLSKKQLAQIKSDFQKTFDLKENEFLGDKQINTIAKYLIDHYVNKRTASDAELHNAFETYLRGQNQNVESKLDKKVERRRGRRKAKIIPQEEQERIQRSLLQMDYYKMVKFIESPITKNILSNQEGHVNLEKKEHLEEEKAQEVVKEDRKDMVSYMVKKSKNQMKFEKMVRQFGLDQQEMLRAEQRIQEYKDQKRKVKFMQVVTSKS